jgi:hypothetical protein
MTADEESDPILRQLARLPVAAPDAARSERVRARCAAALTRRHPSPVPVAPAAGVRPLAWLTLVGGLCVVYLAVVIGDALRLYWNS